MSYNPNTTDWTRPAQGSFSITPGPGALTKLVRGIYVGVAGNVTVTHPDGTSGEFTNLAAGITHPIAATHVTAATATGLRGVY